MEVAESVGLTFFQHETSYFGDLLMFSADSLPPGQSSVPCTEHVSSVETGGLHKGFWIKPPDTLAKHCYPTSPEEL